MLSIKFDRLNQLRATLVEVNSLKIQLLAELDRINKIESDAISELSDVESEILSSTIIIIPDALLAADAKLEDCITIAPDKWGHIKEYDNVLLDIENNIIYVWEDGILTNADDIPEGASNSPLQKAIDRLRGYHNARYNGYLPELSPCINPDTGKKGRLHWWGNHARKQVWYDYLVNETEYFFVDWNCTEPRYWIELAKENRLDTRRKGSMTARQVRESNVKQREYNQSQSFWLPEDLFCIA